MPRKAGNTFLKHVIPSRACEKCLENSLGKTHEGDQKFYHPEAAFWDMDLVIKKQDSETLTLLPFLLKRFRQKNLLQDVRMFVLA